MAAVLAQFPSESIDLVVTSPPYNLRNSTGDGMKTYSNGKWKNAALMGGSECQKSPYAMYVKV